jgi:hypothetical protein
MSVCQLSPGSAVGAAGALTGGVKRLPPVGLMLFSVGATVDDGAVVVVVVVVLDGPPDSPPPQAVSTAAEMAAVMPTVAATRRVSRRFFMMCPISGNGFSVFKITELYRPKREPVNSSDVRRWVFTRIGK